MFDLAGGFFLCEYDLEAILSLSKLVNHSCIKNSSAAVVDGSGLIMLNKIVQFIQLRLLKKPSLTERQSGQTGSLLFCH